MRYEIFYKVLYLFFFIFLTLNLFSQNRSELEERKNRNLERIKVTRQMLEKTKEKREYSVYQVNLLDRRIKERSELINNYKEEIVLLNRQQENIQNIVGKNEKTLKNLKSQYAEIIRNSYRNIDDEYALMYILSSEDINQSYERIRYIKYINNYRNNLYNDIRQKTDSLQLLEKGLDSLKNERELALRTIESENKNLYKDRRQKSRTISELRGKEKELVAEIKEREETQNKIENEIRRIIEEEARRAREENRVYALTPEEQIISDDFNKNKGGLPWPTLQGIVTGQYGEHPHPVIPGIKIRSNGIDLSTVENTDVRAVFKGEVTVVSAILGANYTVIIKHGNYRSVYQNLVNVRVKKGDIVEKKEIIGTVGTNMDNETKLHFELWNGMDVVNPEAWLSK